MMNFQLDNCIALMKQTPVTLEQMLVGLPGDWIHVREAPDKWNPIEIIGHLIEGEKHDWMVRIKIIISHSVEKRFKPFDRFSMIGLYDDMPIQELLDLFTFLRHQNLDDLRSLKLSAQQLALTGIHPEFGDVTLQQLISTWVVHDFSHISQIARILAKQFKTDVGPWEKYLPLLHDREDPDNLRGTD